MGILRRVLGLGKRAQLDNETEAELAAHLAMRTEDNIAAGMTPETAARDARLRFGNPVMMKERVAAADTALFLSSIWADLRYALRQLSRKPAFAVTAIVMLSLGIGASVAIFAFVDAALLKPLPYRDPTRLAGVAERVKLFPRSNLSYPDYLDWKKMNTVFTSLDIYTGTGYMFSTPSGAEPVPGARVSDGFFRTLGIIPILGRDFYAGEDLPGVQPTVLLSYSTWKLRFGARKDVVGQTVMLSGIANTIVGVLPEEFEFAPRGEAEFWAPFHAKGDCDLRRSCHGLYGVSRLRDGVSFQTALADMQSIAGQLERQYPNDNRGQGATVEPLSEVIVGDIRPILLVLLAGACLLLLIACVNVASLLLVRSESRRREIAVRGALGASRGRLIRQFFTEGLLLVSLGGLLGLSLASAAMRLMLGLIPKTMMSGVPFLRGLGLTPNVLAFAGTVMLLALALFAFTPLLRVPLTAMRHGLTEGSRGSAGVAWRRFGANLVVLELAIAVVLLVGAGLLGKSFYKLLRVDVNFQTDHLATVQVMVPEVLYPKDDKVVALARQVVSRISALPGVQSVGITNVLPVNFNGNTDWIRIVGKPYNGEHNEVNQRDVSANYFATLKAKLLRGRLFTDQEDASKPKVILINQTFARQYFPGEDPIGKRLGNPDLAPNSIREIIGIIDDVKEGSLDSPIWSAEYSPFNQGPDTFFNVVVRTSSDEAAFLPTLVSNIHSIDPAVGTTFESTMEQLIQQSPTAYVHRSSAWLVGGFAVLALVLGVVGLYGVIAYSVSQRTREIGVRMALGAPRASVYKLVMTEAGRLTILGIGAGLICSVGAATLMGKLLFATQAWDVSTLAAVALVLGTSGLLASYIPAHRAASVNPVDALRSE